MNPMQNNSQMAANPEVMQPAGPGAPNLASPMPSNPGIMMTGPPPQIPAQLSVPPAPVMPTPNESLTKQESQMNIPASLPSTQTTQHLPMPPVNVPMNYPSNSKDNIKFFKEILINGNNILCF